MTAGKKACCCCDASAPSPVGAASDVPWIDGTVESAAGPVPRVVTALTATDRLGAWKRRWGIDRMGFTVEPRLYAVGAPDETSPVLVSANYKLSFDRLRSRLAGRDAWILVLDTKGVNVWCAAGEGTFGTGELLTRINMTGLEHVVSHRRVIVPQLGATGVSAPAVKKESGFRVTYGPVRAADLPAFLDGGMKATPAMREVRFPLLDRVVLAPVELVASARYALPAAVVVALLTGLGPEVFSLERALLEGPAAAGLLLGAWLTGAAVVPALLPWLPGRAFAVKGMIAGLAYVAAALWLTGGLARGWLPAAGWILALPAMTSYLGMNFTGSSTFTSLSGVLKEMRVAIPIQAACAVAGLAVWVAALFFGERAPLG